jgi:hypothetical protein
MPTQLKCYKCGNPATTSMLKDPFGKSNEMVNLCPEHGPRFRDPQDIAEIASLKAALKRIKDFASDTLGYEPSDAGEQK